MITTHSQLTSPDILRVRVARVMAEHDSSIAEVVTRSAISELPAGQPASDRSRNNPVTAPNIVDRVYENPI
jgi:hypothetical protein